MVLRTSTFYKPDTDLTVLFTGEIFNFFVYMHGNLRLPIFYVVLPTLQSKLDVGETNLRTAPQAIGAGTFQQQC